MSESPSNSSRPSSQGSDGQAIEDLIRDGAAFIEQHRRRRGFMWIKILLVGIVASMGTAFFMRWQSPAPTHHEPVEEWTSAVTDRVPLMPMGISLGTTKALGDLVTHNQTISDIFHSNLTGTVVRIALSGSTVIQRLADDPEYSTSSAFHTLISAQHMLRRDSGNVDMVAAQSRSTADEFQGALLLVKARLAHISQDADEAVESLESTVQTVVDRMNVVQRILGLVIPQLQSSVSSLELLYIALKKCAEALIQACPSDRGAFWGAIDWTTGRSADCAPVKGEVDALKEMASRLKGLPVELSSIVTRLRRYRHALRRSLLAGLEAERGLPDNWIQLASLREHPVGDRNGVRKAVTHNYLTLLGKLETFQLTTPPRK